jgi:hypothetical protein
MKLQFLIAGAAALTLAAATAFAQPAGGGRAAVMKACSADFQKVCPDAKPGPGGGLRECIMSHQSELSDGCKTAIAQMRAQRQQQGGGNSTGH